MGNKAAHLAVGIDPDGDTHVLGMWLKTNEAAKFWTKVRNDRRTRGVKDVLVVVGDGLKSWPEAVESIWPQAWVQTCIVGLMRNSLHLVSSKDRTHVAAALTAIYRAADEQAAASLEDFEAAWAARYPGIPRLWGDAWEQVIPFLALPPEIRTVIYTTNAIESVNYQLRKVTKNRGRFPGDDALLKL